jgi:protein tyrosine phosphatase
MSQSPHMELINNADNANEIIPRLWLGNVRASQDDNFIKQNNIQVVFNCTKNLGFSPSIPQKYRIPLDDNLEEEELRNMALWSNEIAFKIISEYLEGKAILVHCMAGMQRSAAAVAMFLIAFYKMRVQEAIQFIKQKRPIAFFTQANFGPSIEYFDNKFHTEILPQMNKQNIQNTINSKDD